MSFILKQDCKSYFQPFLFFHECRQINNFMLWATIIIQISIPIYKNVLDVEQNNVNFFFWFFLSLFILGISFLSFFLSFVCFDIEQCATQPKNSCDNDRLCQHLTCLPCDSTERQTEREIEKMNERRNTISRTKEKTKIKYC